MEPYQKFTEVSAQKLTFENSPRNAPAPPSGGFKCPWKKKEEEEQGGTGKGAGGKGGGVSKIVNRLSGGAGSAAADGAERINVSLPASRPP